MSEHAPHLRAIDPQEEAAQNTLVFVGGCDRSGTTLISRLLGERFSLVVLPEAYFHAVAYRRFGPTATARQAISHWRRRSWGIDRSDTRAGNSALAPYLRQRMAETYEQRRGDAGNEFRVVETTPENIEVASILLEQFPEAILIHAVRDPRAVAASLRAADFGPTTAQECARFWKQRLASGLAAELQHPDRSTGCATRTSCTIERRSHHSTRPSSNDDDTAWNQARDFMLDPTSRALQPYSDAPIDPHRVEPGGPS